MSHARIPPISGGSLRDVLGSLILSIVGGTNPLPAPFFHSFSSSSSSFLLSFQFFLSFLLPFYLSFFFLTFFLSFYLLSSLLSFPDHVFSPIIWVPLYLRSGSNRGPLFIACLTGFVRQLSFRFLYSIPPPSRHVQGASENVTQTCPPHRTWWLIIGSISTPASSMMDLTVLAQLSVLTLILTCYETYTHTFVHTHTHTLLVKSYVEYESRWNASWKHRIVHRA